MPVPNTMADLAQLAGSNSPAGTEAISNNLDNYLRAQAAILRSTNALSSATISAGSTTDIGSSDAESVQVTGSTVINSFGTGFNGCRREVRFTGACTIAASANIVLPGGANITTAANDVLTFRCIGSGVWTLVAGTRGTSLGYTPINKAGDTSIGSLTMSGTLSIADNVFMRGDTVAEGGQANFARASDNAASWAIDLAVSGTQPNLRILSLHGSVLVPLQFAGTDGAATFGSQVNAPYFNSTGATSGYAFQNRSGAQIYTWLSTSNIAQLYHSTTGLVYSIDSAGNASHTSLTLGGGKLLSKITLSTAAPGVLANGELYLQY